MKLQDKTVLVEEIAADLQQADAVLAVDYRGISVAQIAELRAQLREANTKFRVVKNTLTRRAADRAGLENLKEYLVGPTAFAFINGDIALAAKALNKLASDGELITFKGGLMGGDLIAADDIKKIAKLPGRDVLIGQLAGMVASPLTGIARGMNGLLGGLAIALSQVREQKVAAGDTQPVEPEAEEVAEEITVEEPPTEEPPAEEVKTEEDSQDEETPEGEQKDGD